MKKQEFKKRIIENLNTVDIDFETGFCYKRAIENQWKDTYWIDCYYFLKGIAHYLKIETLR